jgi:hypothetical protein
MKFNVRSSMRNATHNIIDISAQTIPQEVLDALTRLVRELRFGSIEIVVHEGRITQIERREKLRFPAASRQRGE